MEGSLFDPFCVKESKTLNSPFEVSGEMVGTACLKMPLVCFYAVGTVFPIRGKIKMGAFNLEKNKTLMLDPSPPWELEAADH